MIRVPYVSLANLILGRQAFLELLQNDLTADRLVAETCRLTEDLPYREKMLSSDEEVRTLLGGAGASDAVAKAMIDSLRAG